MYMKFDAIHFWSDSEIALCWIKGPPNKWKTFVANRVSEIQNLTDINNWHHVSSSSNPADLVSRGTRLADLQNNSLWWSGPSWLMDKNINIHSKFTNKREFEIPEQRVAINVTINNNNIIRDCIDKFSSARKVQRVVAYILRYIFNLKQKSMSLPQKTGVLQYDELKNALHILSRQSQSDSFYVNMKN